LSTLDHLRTSGPHPEVGFAIGRRFAAQIHESLASYSIFQERLLPFHKSPEGQNRYQQFLNLNRTRYPSYLEELDGIAQGSGQSFEQLFLANMRGEYRGYPADTTPGCSDCVLITDRVALIGHNEDGSPAFRGRMYLVHAKVTGKPGFTALSYPGFLCGNALGFNEEGICFSIDNVRPLGIRIGLGRHFIARSLLEARSLEDALNRVTIPGRASGFSYTVGSLAERRVLNVEVGIDRHHAQEIRGTHFHTNHYQDLDSVEQLITPSSLARMQRAREFLEHNRPGDAAGILSILGDMAEERYPIYRTAKPPDTDATLCTALFDLDARTLRIYTSHPTRAPGEFQELGL
jgi:predicted choloylglycine hydrolase